MRYRPKHIKPNKPHFSVWIMRIAATLCCLTIATTYMLSGVYARFSTTTYGEDSARVAKFDVSVTKQSEQPMKVNFNQSCDKLSDETSYTFIVQNNSEVSIQYTVKVTFDIAPPTNISLKLGDETITCNGTDIEYTFLTVYDYSVGESEKEHALEIMINYIADGTLVEVAELPTSVNISVAAEQKD